MEIKTYTAEELKARTAEERAKLQADYAAAKLAAETVLTLKLSGAKFLIARKTKSLHMAFNQYWLQLDISINS